MLKVLKQHYSRPTRECSEYRARAQDARAPKSPFPLQLALWFSRLRIFVWQCPSLVPRICVNCCGRYLVIDLMSGGDLRFHISRKTFDENAVRFWIAELGCALQYVHQQGIVHRDVKPDNVMLDTEGHVHLADFVGTLPSHINSVH